MPKRKRSTKNSGARRRAGPALGLLDITPPAAPEPDPAAATGPTVDPIAELAAAERLVDEQVPPPLPPPADNGGQASDDDQLGRDVEDVAKGVQERLQGDPELLLMLDDEELAATYDLAFGVVADWRKRPHWELPPKSAMRLGKWTRRVLLKHPELAAWLVQNLADVVLGVLLIGEVSRRVIKDVQLTRAERVAPPPPAAP